MIGKLIKKLRENGFFASAFKVGSGQLIGQALSLIVMPILSRLYAESAYGEQAIITSTGSILISLASFGLTNAVMQPEEDEECKRVFTAAFLLNFVIATLFSLSCVLLRPVRTIFSVSGSYMTALFLMWLYVFAYGTYALMLVYANRLGQYNRLFFNPIIGAVAQFAVGIPLGLMGVGYSGLLFANCLGYILSSLHMMWKNDPFYRKFRFADLITVARQYKRYILFQYPAMIFERVALEYPTQYLGRCFTSQQLGSYSMCVRVLQYPVRLIAGPISAVYFRTATEYHREGKNLAEFTYRMISRLLLISALPVAVFSLISEPLFAFVLGEKWRSAGALASFLVIQYVHLFCTQCTVQCRVAIGRQDANLACMIIQLCAAAVSGFVGYKLFGAMTATVVTLSFGMCLYSIYDMALNFFLMDKKYMWRYILIAVPYTVGMFLLVSAKQLWLG